MIRIYQEGEFHHIIDDVIEENGWIIVETKDHSWELYENSEWYFSGSTKRPFQTYANHELGDAIKQGQLWT